MAMDAREIERLIKEGIPDAKVTIRDLAGDGDHYAAEVVAESFRGKSRVQQHQMVYDALKGNMGGVLHALWWDDRNDPCKDPRVPLGDCFGSTATTAGLDHMHRGFTTTEEDAFQVNRDHSVEFFANRCDFGCCFFR